MNYLNSYVIFENIKRAEKLIDINGLDINLFSSLFDSFEENGLKNYLGDLVNFIINDIEDSNKYDTSNIGDNRTDIIKSITGSPDYIKFILDSFKFIKSNGIDVSKYKYLKLDHFLNEIRTLKTKSKLVKFVNNWCPATLRKDARDIIGEKGYDVLDKFSYLGRLDNLSDYDKELLKKGSRFKNAVEWFKYLNNVLNTEDFNLNELKSSNIKVIFEDNKYFIYKPLDYKSYLIPNFKHWCTMLESEFIRYSKQDLLILLDKEDKKKSYITYLSSGGPTLFNYYNRLVNDRNEMIEIAMDYYKKITNEKMKILRFNQINEELLNDEHKCSICGSSLYRTDAGGIYAILQCSSDDAKFWNFGRGTEEQKKSHDHFVKSTIKVPIKEWNLAIK